MATYQHLIASWRQSRRTVPCAGSTSTWAPWGMREAARWAPITALRPNSRATTAEWHSGGTVGELVGRWSVGALPEATEQQAVELVGEQLDDVRNLRRRSALDEITSISFDATPEVVGTIDSVQATAMSERIAGDPPGFVRLVAHPVRWRLLRELLGSDRAVGELVELLGERQSLVSYHLAQLRGGGLVRTRRSSADRRDRYYSVDLAGCREQLQATGRALHPGLWPTSAAPPTPRRCSAGRRVPRVLFLCTGNSARSQMAEALLESISQGAVAAASAGSHPKPLHPNAVRVMHRRGIDISSKRTKHLDEFVAQRFDLVVTLCDRVREVCPEFPSHPDLVHWSVPDPALEGPNHRASLPAFERTAIELQTRIEFLIPMLEEAPTRRSAHA
jgi:protein-tyrosine-phosphatase/DNA-binding transcriptional ArsR family regulator